MYDNQLSEIRTEVRNIRVIADQMKNELVNLKTSVVVVSDNVDKQSKEIDAAKAHQQKMAETIDTLKAAVDQLENQTIPEKQDELNAMKNEDNNPNVTVYKDDKEPEKKAKKFVTGDSISGKNGYGYAVKDGVILWQRPAGDAEVVEILLAWQKVTILGNVKSEGVSWLKVKTADYTGYVNSKFIIASE